MLLRIHSLLFNFGSDKTSDMSKKEELIISRRFVKNDAIHEEFLCFVPVSSTAGKNLATVMLSEALV